MADFKDLADWDFEYLLSIQPDDEEDWFERKGSQLLDDGNKFRNELATQLSAFANTSAGYIVLGLSDDGKPDGGLPLNHKNGLKEWLERIVPTLTDGPVLNARVRLLTEGDGIEDGCAIVVIHVPESDTVHQHTHDKKYYGRCGAQSLPLPHRVIMALANRRKWPKVEIAAIANKADPHYKVHSSRSFEMQIELAIENTGQIMCRWLGVEITYPHAYGLRTNFSPNQSKKKKEDANELLVKTEATLFPQMQIEIPFILNVPRTRVKSLSPLEGDLLGIKIYADDAPSVRTEHLIAHIAGHHGTIGQCSWLFFSLHPPQG